MKQDFRTPVGRLVQGDPFTGQTTDQKGKPMMTQGGQPRTQFFFAVAFPKMLPDGRPNDEFNALYGQMVQAARAAFPALFNAQGQCTHPRFSFKLIDGDGVDDSGKANNTKEGFAGHWVIRFGGGYAPKVHYAGRYQPHEQVTDKNALKRGYFVRVFGNMEGNGQQQKPGIYMNAQLLEIAYLGPEITSGPDAAAAFGGAQSGYVPQGATALPQAGAPGAQGMAPMVGGPGQGPAVGYAPAVGGMPPQPMGAAAPVGPAGYAPQQPAAYGTPMPGGPTNMPLNGAPIGYAQPMGNVMPGQPMAGPAPAVGPAMSPMTYGPASSAAGVPQVALPGSPPGGVAVQPAPAQFLNGPTPVAAGPQLTQAALTAWPGATLQHWLGQGHTIEGMRAQGLVA